MAVGACIKAIAFSVEGIGGVETSLLPQRYRIETFYIKD